MIKPISIVSVASVSSIGETELQKLHHYKSKSHQIILKKIDGKEAYVSELNNSEREGISKLRLENNKYKNLDLSVLMAIYASRLALQNTRWKSSDTFGINIGSSRGATSLFESYHSQFLDEGKTAILSSPTTTLGNISSWVAHDLQASGPVISHSITCSTSLHAVLNGIAWLNSGMCDKFLVGGSEAPLTAFTIAQMKALKIYAEKDNEYPSRPLDSNKTYNSMILGEAASLLCMEKSISKKSIAVIKGIGYATEVLVHGASLSSDAKCFKRSMSMALGDISPDDIDIIVTHTPGTIKGDQAELIAINEVFKSSIPAMTNNKWKIGHTLGASGLMSVEMAIMMLKENDFFPVPYLDIQPPKKIENIMVNSVGFGGNAVSLIISTP